MAFLCWVLGKGFEMSLVALEVVAWQNYGTYILHMSFLIKRGCGVCFFFILICVYCLYLMCDLCSLPLYARE